MLNFYIPSLPSFTWERGTTFFKVVILSLSKIGHVGHSYNMKTGANWFHWICLIPAYFVGACIGPILLVFCLHWFPIPHMDDLTTFSYVVTFISASTWAFGPTFLCGYVAPQAKLQVATLAGLLSILHLWHTAKLGGANFNWLTIVSLVLGISLALLCLFWMSCKTRSAR